MMTLNNTLRKLAVGVAVIPALAVLVFGRVVSATTYDAGGGITSAGGGGNGGMATATTPDSAVKTITQIAMYVVGIVSVLVIVISGITYATAQGDESKTKKARQGILGGLIGLAIALLAFTLTNWINGLL
jgi:cytochrome bd-type quinol oxidase subunit 2